MMGTSTAGEKFCLRWNDFESNISVAFREIREEKDFFDCTLSCGERQIQAHKIILSACSPFFRTILKQNPHQHPLLYLKGVEFTDLQAVLNFMYHGEVNIAQTELNSFLAVAGDMQVKGLTEGAGGPSSTKKKATEASHQPKQKSFIDQRPTSATQRLQQKSDYQYQHEDTCADDDIQEILPLVKAEPVPVSLPEADGVGRMDMQMESYEEHVEEYGGGYVGVESQEYSEYQSYGNSDVVYSYAAKMGNGKYSCNVCGFITRDKYNIRLHLEGKHELGSGYQCEKCKKYVKTRKDLSEHKTKCINSLL